MLVGVTELVGVTVGVTELVGVTVGVTELVGVTVGVTELVGVTVGVTELVGLLVGEAVGSGVGPTYVTTPPTIVMYVPGTMGTGWTGAETSEETGGASNMPDGAWTIWVLVPKSERTCVPSCP